METVTPSVSFPSYFLRISKRNSHHLSSGINLFQDSVENVFIFLCKLLKYFKGGTLDYLDAHLHAE